MVYLPSADNVGERAARSPEREALPIPAGSGELILVADDEAPIRTVTQRNLEAHGYRVLTANDGVEAVSLYLKHRSDIKLVITDMAMPRLDGQATMQTLRIMNPQLPIIAASGLLTSLDAAQNAGIEFQACLPKPFSMEQLLKTVSDVLHTPSGL